MFGSDNLKNSTEMARIQQQQKKYTQKTLFLHKNIKLQKENIKKILK